MFRRDPLLETVAKHPAIERLDIAEFWAALQYEDRAADPLSLGIASCERMSLFCSRDLGLIFHATDLFLQYGNGKAATDLVVQFAGLLPPKNDGSDQIFTIRNWGVSTPGPELIHMRPHGFTELFSVLTTLNSKQMRYGNAQKLPESAIRYGNLCWTASEKVMLASCQ
jgi:hypothetical protein